ncbi:MAG: helix-turn-helix domain-containing protein, partial [Paraclostridium sp.]
MNLTQEQKEKLGIIDERVDFYFKVENAVVDGYVVEEINLKTGKLETVEKSYFDNVYEFAVFTVLSRYCNNGQVAFPSVPTLAKKCCCGESSIKKAIKSLEQKGFIKKVNRKKPNSQENDSNAYAIKNIEQIIRVGRVATDVGRVATDVGRVATDKKNKLIKNKLKINHDKTLDIFESLFKEFDGINFTKTNQASVKELLKTMSEKNVINYLKETYEELKKANGVKNVASTFSAKIKKGNRQINSKPKVEKTNNPI